MVANLYEVSVGGDRKLAQSPDFWYFVPKVSACPICGSKPALNWIGGEYQYECYAPKCPRGVYEFVEQMTGEDEFPLDICWSQDSALKQWNECVAFYRTFNNFAA